MAEELKEFDFGDRPSNRPKYQWTKWLDGHIWQLKKGEDYDVPTENMRVTLHAKAEQTGRKVRTAKVPRRDDPDHGEWEGLVFQFYRVKYEDEPEA